MKSDNKHGIGMRFALNGIRLVFSQRNFIIQSIFSGLVVVAGFLFQLTTVEWCIILICIAGVLSMELLNSAIELIVDQISPNYSLFAKHAKDMAAGAVLISAVVSAIIGLIIFIPKFIDLYL
jgi:undecaprenol kinase